ncbi:copper amine oxidase N-terminal domain-containing protein [Pseudoneobacillus sp. C159]
MKTRLFKWTLSFIILFSIFPSVHNVKADDEEYERHDGHDEHREEHDHDDEEFEEYERNDDWQSEESVQFLSKTNQQSLWNIWTRDTSTAVTDALPFQEAKEVNIERNGQVERFFIVPQSGQLLISGEKLAKWLEAKFKFYEQTRILEVSKGNAELIFRAGTNAVYENMVKTPMPTRALYYENTVYLPVSVIANSLGYRLSWNAEKETIILEEIL